MCQIVEKNIDIFFNWLISRAQARPCTSMLYAKCEQLRPTLPHTRCAFCMQLHNATGILGDILVNIVIINTCPAEM